ncbi:hypothetical protein CDAR_18911 [Caerostris darwini]|uniref:Uncharacterized protein n=1 Tax=Caerostris darwini TaxID=1538125 RepID=A0AAV4WD70_9ARAC|nr:hypothetical protein CDAR_18911 [Caerostris darwini]
MVPHIKKDATISFIVANFHLQLATIPERVDVPACQGPRENNLPRQTHASSTDTGEYPFPKRVGDKKKRKNRPITPWRKKKPLTTSLIRFGTKHTTKRKFKRGVVEGGVEQPGWSLSTLSTPPTPLLPIFWDVYCLCCCFARQVRKYSVAVCVFATDRSCQDKPSHLWPHKQLGKISRRLSFVMLAIKKG